MDDDDDAAQKQCSDMSWDYVWFRMINKHTHNDVIDALVHDVTNATRNERVQYNRRFYNSRVFITSFNTAQAYAPVIEPGLIFNFRSNF